MSEERPRRDADQSTIPDWQRQILDERITEDDADPEGGSPWEEVKRRIIANLEKARK
jgi:putative addiction module component (TIGR02574 family)